MTCNVITALTLLVLQVIILLFNVGNVHSVIYLYKIVDSPELGQC